MALIRPDTGPRDLGYAVIRTIAADKGTGITQVNVGLFFDAADRADGIGPDESLPQSREARSYSLRGYGLSPADIYTTLAGLPEWQGWESDEGSGQNG